MFLKLKSPKRSNSVHKYFLILLLSFGCASTPWTRASDAKEQEKQKDCELLLEQGASQAEYFSCLSQQ